jgi:hypothetical protein
VLTPDQQVTYEKIRDTATAELEALDRDIAAELVRVRRRLLELQENKRAVTQILDGSLARLGQPKAGPAPEIKLTDLSQYLGEDEIASLGARS